MFLLEPPPVTDFWSSLNAVGILNVGAGGLVTLFVIAFLRGWIFTRAHYRDIVSQRDRWEEAYWKEKAASDLKDQQNLELLEAARTMRHFIDAFPRPIIQEEEVRNR